MQLGHFASGNLESTCERFASLRSKGKVLNPLCLSLVPLANRYPDNKACFLCEPGLVIGVFFPRNQDSLIPQTYDKVPAVDTDFFIFWMLALDKIPSLLWAPFLLLYKR